MSENYVFKKSPYRFLMLSLVCLSSISVNYTQFQLTVFSGPFMQDFALSTTQYSAVILSYTITAGIFGIFGGALADRYGSRKIIVVLAFVSAFGALMRLFTHDFILFFVLSMLVGAFLGGGTAISGKIIGAWFPRKEMNVAFGVYCAGAALGIFVAQSTSFVYSGYVQALSVSGSIILISAFGWLIFGRNAPKNAPAFPGQPLLKYVKHVVRVKNFWLAAIGVMLFMCLIYTVSSTMPVAFIQGKGMIGPQAGLYSSLLNLFSLLGSVFIPFIQMRIGKMRPMLIWMNIIAAALFLLIWRFDGSSLMVMISLAGLFSCVGAPFFMAMLPRFPEIGTEYLGSANGITALIQYDIGCFLLPTFVLVPIIGSNYRILFYVCALLCVLMALCAVLLPEVGEKAAKT
ncbi:MAG: MFS transporter [Clostridiales Family XIII bacterium]|jgi:NNP family nitrate/nitrite transporter-like MFS transporter|nr:MFS transporter [Clostridiales Family XIII bacterium]